MNPLVSVVMSVFNAQDYLEEAILSILGQQYETFEFIIVNDGSTDNSLEIIKGMQQKDSRIVLVSRENKGLIASLNDGISIANGDYIVRMDADDISSPQRVSTLVSHMENNTDIDIAGSYVASFGENKKQSVWKFPPHHEAIRTRLLFTVPICHGSSIFRTSIFKKDGYWFDRQFEHAEDYELFSRLDKNYKFGMIPKILYRVRFVEDSVTRVADENFRQRMQVIARIFCRSTDLLGLELSDEEIALHFILTTSDRIIKHDLDIAEVDQYFSRILAHNKQKAVFDERYLFRILARKYLTVFYYQYRRSNFSIRNGVRSKFLYKGIFDALCAYKI